MASPLGWFRRNQKGMLIVFGTILMAVFGLGSVFDRLVSGGRSGNVDDKVVVEFNGGQFTSGQLYNLRFRHHQTVRFLQALRERSQQIHGDGFQPRANMFAIMQTDGPPQFLDRQVMERYILAHKAHELGIKVGDAAVLDYLQAFSGDDAIMQNDLEQLTREVFGGQLDFIVIKEQLKQELAISSMNSIARAGFPGIPNLTNGWENFKKLNQRIEAAVLKFPVDDFVDQISQTPTDSELRKIFEEGRYLFPHPTGEQPGFKTRSKISATLLTATYEDFVQREMQKITPELVQTEYERLVAAKDSLVMELVPQVPDNKTPTPVPGDDKPPTLEIEGDSNNEDGKNAAEKKSDDDKKGSDKKGSDDSGSESDQDENNNQENDLSINLSKPKMQLVSTAAFPQQDTTENNQNSEQKEQGDVDQKKEQQSDDSKTQTQTSEETTEAVIPATQETDPAETDPAEAGLNVDDLQTAPERRVKPLDEALSKIIQRRLASQPAERAMQSAIDKAKMDIDDYWADFKNWEDTKDLPANMREPKPDPVDFEAIATKYKLTHRHTGLQDREEMASGPVGKLNIRISVPSQIPNFPAQERPFPIASYLFDQFHVLEVFRPEPVVEYIYLNQHILFIEEKVEPTIQDFSAAKPEVEEFWRRRQATELAVNEAQKKADEISARQLVVLDEFKDDAIATGEFVWFMGALSYPELPGGIQTGEDFMKSAFGLEINEVGVALSGDRENAFVIQKTKNDARDVATLQEEYFTTLATNNGMPVTVNRVYVGDFSGLMQRWYREMEDKLDVKWVGH